MRLMLEVVPPSRRASPSKTKESAMQIAELARTIGGVECIDIPEIVEENYQGVPLYKHLDTREFCLMLKGSCAAACMPNKITVYLKSKADLEAWLRESISRYGIKNVVFVGGINSNRRYYGPSVMEANEVAVGVKGLSVGNICLPSRPGELERLLAKTAAGASFFTTQAILNAEQTVRLVREYYDECRKRRIGPSTIFLSFPVATSAYDIDFLRWLGAEMNERDAARLAKSADVERASREQCSKAFSEIVDSLHKDGVKVPIGVNIEALSATNLGATCGMADALRSVSKI